MSTANSMSNKARWVIPLGISLVLLVFGASATGSVAGEQRQGGQILAAVDGGRTSCDELTETDFDHVGEYVMGRVAGSTTAHEAMNQMMVRMMGPQGEAQAHIALGQRATGCGTASFPDGFGAMMGAAGMMSGYAGGGSGGMMGAGGLFGASDSGAADPGGSFGPGSMMGRSGTPNHGSDDGSGWPVLIVVLLVLAVGAALIGLVRWKPWRAQRATSPTALEILRGRLASGQITTEEYEAQRRVLKGGSDAA